MYNTQFEAQIERFHKDLFGAGNTSSPREASQELYRRYAVPAKVSIIPCVEDVNGEWVPQGNLEKMTSETPK